VWYKSKIAIAAYVVIFGLLIVGLGEGDKTNDVVKNTKTASIPKTEKIIEVKNVKATDTKIVNNKLYQVIKVVDGDTLSLSINGQTETIRLIGINTPETVDPRKPVECFGKQASDKAKSLLSGQEVALETDPSQGERDKYDRLLGYIFFSDGTFFNKLMIQEGYAYEYTYNVPYKYQAEFKQSEQEAKLAKRGLWADGACAAPSVSTKIVQPVASPVNSGQYVCSHNAYNCSDFSSQVEAQATFEACGGINNDIHQLDRDGDGRVCESLK
jgi:micrococcal nuclease